MTFSPDDSLESQQPTSETRTPLARRRAVELLERVLQSRAVTVDEVAETLMVRTSSIADFRSGKLSIPIEVQLLLVALVIERVPTHRRLAHQLRSQLKATIEFASGQTVTHQTGPYKWPR